MPTSLCCLVLRDMCDRYPEQISGKFPQRERKKQIPIHLMKVRALKARKRKRERERDDRSSKCPEILGRRESIFLSISWEPCTVSFTKEHASPLTAIITFAAETSTIDYRRPGIICTRPTTFYRELEHAADVHLSHAFRCASLLRDAYVTCRYSLLLIF